MKASQSNAEVAGGSASAFHSAATDIAAGNCMASATLFFPDGSDQEIHGLVVVPGVGISCRRSPQCIRRALAAIALRGHPPMPSELCKALSDSRWPDRIPL